MKTISAVAVLALVAGSAAAQTYTIDFENDAAGNAIANGATLSNQYAAWGATFVPNVLSGTTWATNTDMTITSTDVGGGYNPIYGKVLHSFNGWFAEDGDPNFAIFFSTAISSLSVSFIGDSTGVSEVAAFDGLGNYQTGGVVGAGGSSVLKTVTLTGLNATEIGVILPGDFGDWAAVVSITYTLVPAPSSLALLGLGGLVAGRRRR
ncbi:MAG: PEP-CTERM sorting domain-containing protein [Planctomycetota bacterium]|nr:PEP-CTERM sorting domain-containing protein [Planctomycetota bacterium]